MNENKEIKSAFNYGRDSGYANGFVDGYKAGVKDAKPENGHWKLHKSGALFICSACEETSLRTERCCPNCCAKMEEVTE